MSRLYYTFFLPVISLSLCLLVTAYIEECPDPEDNYPCYCEEDDETTVMHCNHFNESKQITQALSKLRNYKVYKISFYKSEIQNIKSDAFRGPAVNQMLFQNSTVSFEAPQFSGLESSLTRITFIGSFNDTNPMHSWSLSHLEALKEMMFDRNVIRVLKNDWLTSVGPKLRSITFAECSIQKLEDKAFAKLENLATLFLYDNQISSISRSMFPKPAENLRSIDLKNNKLEDLPDDLFKSMPSLTTIELQNNMIKTLPESLWSPKIESLSRVYLEGNPIRCDKNLKWISKKGLPRTFTGKCSEPARLKGREIRLLTPAEFH